MVIAEVFSVTSLHTYIITVNKFQEIAELGD